MEQLEDRQEIVVTDYLLVLFRRRYLILLSFSIVFILIAIKTLLTKPVYESKATLQLEERTRESELLSELVIMSRWNPVNTEMEILKSRTVGEEVVRETGLDREVINDNKDLTLNIENFSTDSINAERIFTIKFTDNYGSFSVFDGETPDLGKGVVGRPFTSKPLSFNIVSTNAKKGDNFKIKAKPFNKVVKSIIGNIKVKDVGEQTNIIEVSFRYNNPEKARLILNKIIEVYLKKNIERKSQDISQTLEFITVQLESVRKELEKSEMDLDRYKTEHGYVELSASTTNLIDKLSDFEKTRTELSIKKKQIEPLYNTLKDNNNSSNFILPTITTDDPIVSEMVKNLAQLEVQRRALLEEYTEQHPQIISITTQINELKKKILDTLENTLDVINKQEKSLTSIINRYEGNLKEIPQAERELAGLLRSARVNEEIYTFLLKKHEEAKISKAATVSNVRVIDPPSLPEFPVEPKKKKNLIIGFLMGILFGITIGFIAEFLDDSIKSVEEVEKKLKLTIYGSIPHFPDQFSDTSLDTTQEGRTRRQTKLFTQLDPRSSIAEAYRSLRTNIQFAEIEKPMKTIVITSTGPAEGKSTTAVNIAISIAQTGLKTLLMDCDLRKPSVHRYFNVPQEPGISNYLFGKASLDNVLLSTEYENLNIITSGSIPPNPAELLSSAKMTQFLNELKEKFEFMIIDSPPILAVTDAVVLSSRVDAVFLVIQAGRATIQGVTRAYITLKNVNAPLKGAIVNDLKAESFLKYGYYRYYYRYPYYYYYYTYSKSYGDVKKPSIIEMVKNFIRSYKRDD
jgi:tyrosine-protein kinase Etk/Wzc